MQKYKSVISVTISKLIFSVNNKVIKFSTTFLFSQFILSEIWEFRIIPGKIKEKAFVKEKDKLLNVELSKHFFINELPDNERRIGNIFCLYIINNLKSYDASPGSAQLSSYFENRCIILYR